MASNPRFDAVARAERALRDVSLQDAPLEDKPLSPEAHELRERFRAAMRGTASGVAVLATDGPAGRAGVTVSTLCSLSLEPPSVIACVHHQSRTLPLLVANGTFSANVLAEDQQAVAEIFSAPRTADDSSDSRFAVGNWRSSPTGSPQLEGAIASFECRLAATFAFGSHRIIVGEVFDVAARATRPLVYSGRMFQRIAS